MGRLKIREDYESKEIRSSQTMFDQITVIISDIRHHVLDGADREMIAEELAELEEALS